MGIKIKTNIILGAELEVMKSEWTLIQGYGAYNYMKSNYFYQIFLIYIVPSYA